MRKGWEYKKLGEIAIFINGDRGKNYPSVNEFVDDGIPFINAGHLCAGTIDFSKMNYITRQKYDVLGSGKIQKGDILFCLRGSLGKYAIVEDDVIGAIASSLVIIRVSKDINNKYIAYFLASTKVKDLIGRDNNGSSQPNLSAKSVASFGISLPPINIQAQIVSELDKINELIRLKKEQLVEYDNLAQSIFYEMFGDPVENEKGWEVKKLSEVCTLSQGLAINKQTKHYIVEKSTIPLLRIKDMKEGTREIFIDDNDYPQNCLATPEEIIYTRTGTLGLAFTGMYGIVHNNCFKIKVDYNSLDKKFFMFYISGTWFKNKIVNLASRSSQPDITHKLFLDQFILSPPLPLQQSFASRIEQIEKLKSEVQNAITDLETLLASRMQYWFE